MAEVKPSTSLGEDAVEIVGEASCSGEAGSTSPRSVPPTIAAESASFLTWMWIQILTVCSGVWGVIRGGLSGCRMSGLASGAQQTQKNSESEVLGRIAASKSTWSEVPAPGMHHSVSAPCPSNLSVWEELKASAPNFFSDDWVGDLELGPLIAEGGQAHIFKAKFKGSDADLVLKVFKLDAGFSLADLQRHWPHSMRRKDGEVCSESSSTQKRSSRFVFDYVISNLNGDRCMIWGATLLPDGRFGFLMRRYWGDLRTLIDLRLEDNTHPSEFDLLLQPPFSFRESISIMSNIASGMQGLHEEGVLHRDLKAANVLITNQRVDQLICFVADYECAMFVQGTGFWRAPEILQELQKNEVDRTSEIWTEKVDVYSFGMTCYEILTGQIPFDGYFKSKWGDVIRGERPSLPDYVFPKLQELVEACWHTQPSRRPSFQVIIGELDSLRKEHTTWN